MIAVHQFLPSLAPRDAQSQHHLHVRDALRSAGYASEIYAGEAKGELRSQAQPFRSFDGDRTGRSWILYAHAIGSPVADFVRDRPEPLMLYFHNITPSSMFAPWEPTAAIKLGAGRRQLPALVARSRLAMANSTYSETELIDLGARRTAVVPVMFDTDNFASSPDQTTRDELAVSAANGVVNLLFVGRLAPNKAQHRLIASLAALRQGHGIEARLHLVGGSASDRYERTLHSYVEALGLSDSVSFVGSATPAVLAAYYQSSTVFVSASEHEGFCVPILEAWYHDLPVVALATTAVDETLGSAGARLRSNAPTWIAAAVARVVNDPRVTTALRARGRQRLDEFGVERSKARLLEAVRSVVES
jgi:glycosyltransferase involved in cell wall biosynthesis